MCRCVWQFSFVVVGGSLCVGEFQTFLIAFLKKCIFSPRLQTTQSTATREERELFFLLRLHFYKNVLFTALFFYVQPAFWLTKRSFYDNKSCFSVNLLLFNFCIWIQVRYSTILANIVIFKFLCYKSEGLNNTK